MRRGLGFKLIEAGKGLRDFVRFMQQHRAAYITQALALAWAQQPSNAHPAHWAQRLCFVRGFARYRSATDPRTQIPPPGLLPFQPKWARPYLYSDMEIEQLLRATLNMPLSPRHCKRCALLPWVYCAGDINPLSLKRSKIRRHASAPYRRCLIFSIARSSVTELKRYPPLPRAS
jgi:integrase/recombinase XerD